MVQLREAAKDGMFGAELFLAALFGSGCGDLLLQSSSSSSTDPSLMCSSRCISTAPKGTVFCAWMRLQKVNVKQDE